MRTKPSADVVTDRLVAIGWHPLPPAVQAKIEADFHAAVAEAQIKLANEITPEVILRAGKQVAVKARQSDKPEITPAEQTGGAS